MSYIPNQYDIILKLQYGYHNCSIIQKVVSNYYLCNDYSDSEMEKCCKYKIHQYIGNYKTDVCYSIQDNNKYTHLVLECSNKELSNKDLYNILMVIGILFSLLCIIVIISIYSRKQLEKNIIHNEKEIKLKMINSEYKYNSMYQTF